MRQVVARQLRPQPVALRPAQRQRPLKRGPRLVRSAFQQGARALLVQRPGLGRRQPGGHSRPAGQLYDLAPDAPLPVKGQ